MKRLFFILLKIIQYSTFIVCVVVSTMIENSTTKNILIIAEIFGFGSLIFDLWFYNRKEISDETDRKYL
jgi:hypothetical protein